MYCTSKYAKEVYSYIIDIIISVGKNFIYQSTEDAQISLDKIRKLDKWCNTENGQVEESDESTESLFLWKG